MESVINGIEFNFEQRVSIRTDVKLSKEDLKQIVSEAPKETQEEIIYQSLITDELYLRAQAKEIAAKLK
jgi:predicted metal-dependent hydrolase|tara:strand:- start:389 stop:595 length:207 start_codon:yes stop_codon:yes gene_type:complete